MIHVFYTLVLSLSAACMTLALCSVLRHVYPSLRVFFPHILPDAPYGLAMALVACGFSLVVFAPLPVIVSALLAVVGSGYIMATAKPLSASLLLGTICAAIAFISYQPMLPDAPSLSYRLVLLMATSMPLFAASVASQEKSSVTALYGMAGALKILCLGVVLLHHEEVTRGITDALLLCVVIASALYYHHFRKAGMFGLSALLPLSVLSGFVLITIAQKTTPILVLAAGSILIISMLAPIVFPKRSAV